MSEDRIAYAYAYAYAYASDLLERVPHTDREAARDARERDRIGIHRRVAAADEVDLGAGLQEDARAREVGDRELEAREERDLARLLDRATRHRDVAVAERRAERDARPE